MQPKDMAIKNDTIPQAPPNHVTILQKYRYQLLGISAITESDIRNIFITIPDKVLTSDELSSIQYDPNSPLYQKMIFRYRNGHYSPTTLYQGCDPNNRIKMLVYFGITNIPDGMLIMDFFSWLKFNYGDNKLLDMIGAWILTKGIPINEISLFFSLFPEAQQSLVEEYMR
jgi:hypothetical protein